jgi:hypothetical protein
MNICHVCGCDLIIRLDADYSSSGMWCGICGVCYSNPEKDFPEIPLEIITTINFWNLTWEMAMEDDQLNKQHFEKTFKNMGFILAEMVNEYLPCYFDDTFPTYY